MQIKTAETKHAVSKAVFGNVLRPSLLTEDTLEKHIFISDKHKKSFSDVLRKVAIVTMASSVLALSGCSSMPYTFYGAGYGSEYNYAQFPVYYQSPIYYQPPVYCFPYNHYDDDDFGR